MISPKVHRPAGMPGYHSTAQFSSVALKTSKQGETASLPLSNGSKIEQPAHVKLTK